MLDARTPPFLRRFLLEEESGQDLVEYTLLLAFIGLAAAAVMSGIEPSLNTIWSKVNSSLTVSGS